MLTQTREGDQSVSLVLRENMFVAETADSSVRKTTLPTKYPAVCPTVLQVATQPKFLLVANATETKKNCTKRRKKAT